MNWDILFNNGTSQAFYVNNWMLISIFEIMTILAEAVVIGYLNEKKLLNGRWLYVAVLAANFVSFCLGSVLWYLTIGSKYF